MRFKLRQVNAKLFTVLILSLASAAFAEDFKTINGKEYKDATVTRIEPDGIVVKTKSGITKLSFTELPKEVQERFHYDPQKATAYSAEQTGNYNAYQKREEEAQHQRAELAAKDMANAAEQRAVTDRVHAMQQRYATLQQQEDALLLSIGEAKKPGPAYYGGKNNRTLLHHPNPQKSQLPLLQSHLSDIRREKTEVRKQLEKAQH